MIDGVQIRGPMSPSYGAILTDEALVLVRDLVRTFRERVAEAHAQRAKRRVAYSAGQLPKFRADTAAIRTGDWTVATLPKDLLDRRVEITGPVERKMIINALNSGANVFMADFEDSNAPTWANVIEGQIHLRDAANRTITFERPGKSYRLNTDPAVLMVRPRGWHLVEQHLLIDGAPAIAGLVDFGLYLFHNHAALKAHGTGPYFYLPKLEAYEEAQIWNDAFVFAQDRLGIANGTIKATVLIETLPGAFEMDEILYALKDHSAGLNCGRWDYIFSYIKTVRAHADRVLPDRGQVGMSQRFMDRYTRLVIQTCHRRKVHAMGGMAAQIPIKSDPAANEAALEKVRLDKVNEANKGHDGTWVAHPGLVGIARKAFDAVMTTANQIDRITTDVITEADLLAIPEGTRTWAGLRHNIRVGVQYLEAWLQGNGCVPLYHLMEDAATAEISRTQIWQWVKHGAALDDGTVVTYDLVQDTMNNEMQILRATLGDARWEAGRFEDATALFLKVATDEPLVEFLTLPAYEHLLTLT